MSPYCDPPEITLPGHQTSAAYGGNIYLNPEDWDNWDVIIHEYGHLVAGTAGFFGLTGGPWAWDHSTGENARITNPSADPYDQMQLGFNEGWSNFFSVVCQGGTTGTQHFVGGMISFRKIERAGTVHITTSWSRVAEQRFESNS